MNTETPNATTIDPVVTTVDQPAADPIILDKVKPKPMPIRLPGAP